MSSGMTSGSIAVRGVVGVVGVGIIALAVLGMDNLIDTSRTDYEQRQKLLAEASAGGEAGVVSGVWLEFTEAGLQQALAQVVLERGDRDVGRGGQLGDLHGLTSCAG